ncbi:hypothetical protein [Pseudoalteromonas denitrificans]|uniref:Uncharacterized protein n=1 Tax=Pseudoalteromonas denitrificans DSM 6059 TaxID=1123010 RepID=A0A1I1TJ48_9GAMM|nr:hypothetical protein [Pseudoalteromonas denitrificans]SFD58642.1 hypothetical protein SAMN02745724_04909 [Pseudoalteromonas denitrificans DSM 6059]
MLLINLNMLHFIKSITTNCILIFFLCNAFISYANTEKNEDKSNPKKAASSLVSKKRVSEWDDWNKKMPTQPKYGVGIQGDIEQKLNQLDKSNLLNDVNGVLVKKNKEKIITSKIPKPKNIKQMMAELEAMEAEVKQELSNESEF